MMRTHGSFTFHVTPLSSLSRVERESDSLWRESKRVVAGMYAVLMYVVSLYSREA
jgi:hypothetical protein